MKTMTVAILAALASAAAFAGPADKLDPVADGFPDWQGMTAKNYIRGRIGATASDLRHKVTIVIDVEPNEKLAAQMLDAADLLVNNSVRIAFPEGGAMDTWMPQRDVIGVVSCWGGANHKVFEDALTAKKGADIEVARRLAVYRDLGCYVYDNVTFTGAPDSTGKRPYVYVMGPSGKEPIWQGPLNAAAGKEVRVAIAKGRKAMKDWGAPWRPFFGYIAEPKFHPQLAKTLEKAKTAKSAPLDPVAKAILADVKSKDEEKAKEAQVLFDAINQTRSDMLTRITLLSGKYPHLAIADLTDFVKYWPGEKKNLATAYERIKKHPEAEFLAKLYVKAKVWADPEFTCKNAGEAKKIVAELTKAKKAIAKLKDSAKDIPIQDAALLLDVKLDELISSIPSRVAGK